jgi:hypothetical protein
MPEPAGAYTGCDKVDELQKLALLHPTQRPTVQA